MSVTISRCSETGIATLMVVDGERTSKLDLMPDEAIRATELAKGDKGQALTALLTGIDAPFCSTIEKVGISAICEELKR